MALGLGTLRPALVGPALRTRLGTAEGRRPASGTTRAGLDNLGTRPGQLEPAGHAAQRLGRWRGDVQEPTPRGLSQRVHGVRAAVYMSTEHRPWGVGTQGCRGVQGWWYGWWGTPVHGPALLLQGALARPSPSRTPATPATRPNTRPATPATPHRRPALRPCSTLRGTPLPHGK